jgi:hypothetical protein
MTRGYMTRGLRVNRSQVAVLLAVFWPRKHVAESDSSRKAPKIAVSAGHYLKDTRSESGRTDTGLQPHPERVPLTSASQDSGGSSGERRTRIHALAPLSEHRQDLVAVDRVLRPDHAAGLCRRNLSGAPAQADRAPPYHRGPSLDLSLRDGHGGRDVPLRGSRPRGDSEAYSVAASSSMGCATRAL